jgi:hypothetical protein
VQTPSDSQYELPGSLKIQRYVAARKFVLSSHLFTGKSLFAGKSSVEFECGYLLAATRGQQNFNDSRCVLENSSEG